MIIGGRRPEEAKVFDSAAGTHKFDSKENSFEVLWSDGGVVEDGPCEGVEIERAGWYWIELCSEGCCPCLGANEPHGPFGSSFAARDDANEE